MRHAVCNVVRNELGKDFILGCFPFCLDDGLDVFCCCSLLDVVYGFCVARAATNRLDCDVVIAGRMGQLDEGVHSFCCCCG